MVFLRHSLHARWRRATTTLAAFVSCGLLPALALALGPTEVHPGFNLFSKDQEVEIGKESAQEVEREIPVLHDSSVTRYVEALGSRLVEQAPGAEYPYRFRVLDVADVNAFALPGGFVYVNRGLLESVRNEDELAGVLAHEIGHVALRHSTNQISKQYLAQAGLSVLGGLIGNGNTAHDILQVVGGAGVPLLFLKFSRTAEEQADTVGAQIMSRAGYNAVELADFFQRLESESGGGPPQFLSSHPSYESRRENIRHEASLVARANRNPIGGLPRVQARLDGMPPARKMADLAGQGSTPNSSTTKGETPSVSSVDLEPPSSRFAEFTQNHGFYRIGYPENWNAYEAKDGFAVTIAPENGIVDRGSGRQEIVAGLMVNHYTPFLGENERPLDGLGFRSRQDIDQSSAQLREATRDLLVQILDGNPHLQPVTGSMRTRELDCRPSISVALAGTSPVTGERENVTLLTREAGDGHVIYVLLVRPGKEADSLDDALERMVDSLDVNDQSVHFSSH